MPTRKRKQPVRIQRTRGDLAESLKLNVRRPDAASGVAEYVRIGPDSPLWHERMAELTVKRARGGDTDAALDILRDFVGAIDQFSEQTWRGPVYWPYARYIAEAFEKIVRAKMREKSWTRAKWSDAETGEAEADANLALGTKSSKPGRPKGNTAHNEEALAAALNLLVLNGFTSKQAKLHLYELTGAVPRTIEKANRVHIAYQMYARQAMDAETSAQDRDFAAEVLKVGAAPLAAKIAAIFAARKKR